MNLKHARYILTIIKEGNITNAAKKLFISQPSLSQTVKLVEKDLGTIIFDRNTDPISLTAAGEKYVSAVKQIIMISNNLYKEIDETTNYYKGKLRFGIPVQRALQLLPYIINVFKSKYPNVDLNIYENGSVITENMILSGDIDIGCSTTYPKYEDIEYVLVEKEKLILIAGKETELSKKISSGTPINIREAEKEKFVLSLRGHNIRVITDRLFASQNIDPNIMLETRSIEVAKRVAIDCNGVMVCPLDYMQMTPELMKRCSMYPIIDFESNRDFYVFYRKDAFLTKYMRDLIDIVFDAHKESIVFEKTE